MGRPLIHIVFTDKWMPALPLLHIFAGAIAIGFIVPVAAAALDAAGKPQIVARLALGWTALNWVIVLLATPRFGLLGFVAGYSVHVVVGNLVVLVVLLYVVPGVRVVRRLFAAVLGGAAAYVFGFFAAPHAMTLWTFVGASVASFVIYTAVVLAVDLRGVKDAIALVPKAGEKETGDV
jgi:O-antigen/teichoic acid export membrane protein